MIRLLKKWRHVAAEYHRIKSPADDFRDLFWGMVSTAGILAWAAIVLLGGNLFGAGLSFIIRSITHG